MYFNDNVHLQNIPVTKKTGQIHVQTRTVFKKTGRKSGRNKHNTGFYISEPGNSLQDQSKDQQSIISNLSAKAGYPSVRSSN